MSLTRSLTVQNATENKQVPEKLNSVPNKYAPVEQYDKDNKQENARADSRGTHYYGQHILFEIQTQSQLWQEKESIYFYPRPW